MTTDLTRQQWRRPAGLLSITATLAASALLLSSCSSSGGGTGSASKPAGSSSSGTAKVDSAQFPGKAATGSTIKIGLINPEGGSAVSQPNTGKAALAAAAYANANLGGIAGHKIQVDYCKDLETTTSARTCANQMVSDKVVAVVDTTTAYDATMVPIITGAGIPYTTVNAAGVAALTNKLAFSWTGGFSGTLIDMAKFAAGKGYKKVTALATNAPSVIAGVTAAGVPAFKAAGITLKVVGIPIGAADVTPQVSSAVTDKPDAILVVEDSAGCTSVLKAAGTLQVTAAKLLIQPCLDPATTKAVGSSMDGAFVFAPADTYSSDPDTQLYLAAMNKYAPGVEAQGYSVVGWASMLGLVRVLKGLTGEPTPATVASTIRSATDTPLPAGHGITFTCNGQQIPQLISTCSTSSLVLTFKGGKGTDYQVIK